MTQTLDFQNWTEYDDWLIQNYDAYGMTSLNEVEVDGKKIIRVEFIEKAEWMEVARKLEAEKEAKAQAEAAEKKEA